MWYRISKQVDKVSRPLFIFDIDDTLLTTGAKIIVKKGDRTVVELTPAEFNTFDLENNPIILKDKELSGPGSYNFDFSQFMDSILFQKTSAPITPMIGKVKALLSFLKSNPNGKIIFNTARSDFDAKEPVLQTFEKLGLPMDPSQDKYIHVNRSGNYSDKIPTSQKKNKLLLDRYLSPGHNFTSVHFWDDDAKNLDAFLDLPNQADHLQGLPLKAYRVKHDGSTEVWNKQAKQRYEEEIKKKTESTAEKLDVPALTQEPSQ